MKKKMLSLVLVLVMVLTLLPVSAFAGNTPSLWAVDEVNAAINTGLIPDYLQDNYQEPVSRAEVAEMFVRLLEYCSHSTIDKIMEEKGVTVNSNAFTDTDDYNVLACNALGIINGIGSNKFDPNGTFQRAQIAAIINRVAKVMGIETTGYTHSFTDVEGHWCSPELGWPVANGVINGVGDNKFAPNSDLTTEQAIVITYRAVKPLYKEVPETKVSLNTTEKSIMVGDSFSLTATVNPQGESVTWSSSNASVASVNNGKVTGVSAGSAVITVKAGSATASCTVTVKALSASDFVGKANDAIKELKSILKNPASLQVHSVRVYIYDAPAGHMTPIEIDYSAMNSLGGYNRNYYIYFYEDALGNHSAKSTLGNSLRSDIKYQTIEIDLSLLNLN